VFAVLNETRLSTWFLLYIQNAGTDGAKRDAILEYLQGTLPSRNTDDQNAQLVGNILKEMNRENIIALDGNLCEDIKNE